MQTSIEFLTKGIEIVYVLNILLPIA